MTTADLVHITLERIITNLGPISFQGKTIVVTGGAGFLGSWICDVLIRQGARVTCIDNLSSGLRQNVEHLINLPAFRFVKQDVVEPMETGSHVDAVLHMASRASPFEFTEHPIDILKTNTIGTLNALEIARRRRAVFLFTSTSEAYGEPAIVPTPESYRGNVSSTGIRSCYDEAKRCGEAAAMAYHRQFGVDVRIARIFNTYGPRMRGDGIYGRAVPRFISQALAGRPITVFGTGQQTRSFTYIADQVEGLLRLASLPEASGRIVNIGNNHETTVLELARMVKDLVSSASPIVFEQLPPDDPTRRCPDISLARTVLHWQPKTSLSQGLADTAAWFRESTRVPVGPNSTL